MTRITDLPVDVVSRIIYALAKAPDGARDVARSMVTCKIFLDASKSNVVRKAVCFDYAQILRRRHLFRKTNGLLYVCAKSSNPSAEFQIAQVILMTCTQLVEMNMLRSRVKRFRNYRPRRHGRAREDADMAKFIASFTPTPRTNLQETFNNSHPWPLSYHWEFVKVFILKSTPTDIIYMSRHVNNYIDLFTAWQFYSDDVFAFLDLLRLLSRIAMAVSTHNTILVQNDLDQLYAEGSIPTRISGGNHERQTGDLFEGYRVKLINAFEVIIPKLH